MATSKNTDHDHHKDGEECKCSLNTTGCEQTIDEIEFEKSLFYACVTGDLDRCKILLNKHGRSIVDQQDKAGYTALAYAARNNRLDIARLLTNGYGADPNLKTNSNKMTPLHRATMMGHVDMVKLLIDYKRTNPFEIDADGKTALDICKDKLASIKRDENSGSSGRSQLEENLTNIHTILFETFKFLLKKKQENNHSL